MATRRVAQAKRSGKSLLTEAGDLFSDFGFGMSLLAVWGVMTLIGVIVDQEKDPSVYFQSYPAALARLVLRLHFDKIYHSNAYVGMIALILAAMTFATFKRVIPMRMPPLRPVKIEMIPLHAAVPVRGDEAGVRERIGRFFTARGWQVKTRAFGGEEWTFVDKHDWARRGVLVAHVGFCIIAAGTTIYWARGYSDQFTLLSGQSQVVPKSNATVQLREFRYRIDPIQTRSGIVYQPIDYVSYLRVKGNDGVWRDETLRVNHPIDVDGVSYYQATYGFAMKFDVLKDGKPVAALSPSALLREGEGFPIGSGTRSVEFAKFVGTIDRRTGGIGADPRLNNPGVVLSVFDGDQNIGSVIVPIGKALDLGGGFSVVPERWTLFSGLQYRFDPGVPLVGLGAFVLLGGLIVSFYFVPARLYVRLDRVPAGDAETATKGGADTGAGAAAWSVGVAATTVKGYDIFEEQFTALVEALRESERPGPRAAAAAVPAAV